MSRKKQIGKAEGPSVLINACTHGDELIGVRVQEEIKKLKIVHGTIIYNIANPKAKLHHKRFIEKDLNRSFPGKSRGSYEERLAYKLNPLIQKCDVVIDIHSTTSTVKDAVIVTKINNQTRKLLRMIPAKYILEMSITKDNALISSAPVGIGLELGDDKSDLSLNKNTKAVKSILKELGMISNHLQKSNYPKRYFRVTGTLPKQEGFILSSKIKNFKLVKKGEVIAFKDKRELKARKDFYPVLFGEKNYKDIYGFMGIEKKL